MSTITPVVESNVKTPRSILQRINRVLRRRGEKLVRSVGAERGRLGGWYLVHEATGQITAVCLDLKDTAIFLNVLRPWETIGEPDGR